MENFTQNPEDHREFDEFEKETLKTDASKGQRFANFIIDGIVFYIFCVFLGMLLGAFLAQLPQYIYILENITNNVFLNYLFGFILVTIFYTCVEYFSKGRSVGKLITNTKVITEDGDIPSFKDCLIRSMCRSIPFEPFSFFGEQGWHDSISETRVVKM